METIRLPRACVSPADTPGGNPVLRTLGEGIHRKSRDFDATRRLSLAIRSATTVTAPLAFCT
jgi:hypothetical protein